MSYEAFSRAELDAQCIMRTRRFRDIFNAINIILRPERSFAIHYVGPMLSLSDNQLELLTVMAFPEVMTPGLCYVLVIRSVWQQSNR